MAVQALLTPQILIAAATSGGTAPGGALVCASWCPARLREHVAPGVPATSASAGSCGAWRCHDATRLSAPSGVGSAARRAPSSPSASTSRPSPCALVTRPPVPKQPFDDQS